MMLRPAPARMGSEGLQASGSYYGNLRGGGYIILEDAPSPSPRPMGRDRGRAFHLPTASLPSLQPNKRGEPLDAVRIEEDLNRLIERRARQAGEDRPGQARANEEADRQRAVDARYRDSLRLLHARAWCEYFGGLSLRHHDLAAENAAKRDEYAAIVRKLGGEGVS